jgi:hypothetical protein
MQYKDASIYTGGFNYLLFHFYALHKPILQDGVILYICLTIQCVLAAMY